ncbi:type VII toxin-antitoxin system HepT family RNase toxin [Desulfotruncus alcoholivorax]|uniref:type VII toxin-antitoxin system HepT family RNase toxin n=1 Tax=Desulfotruncus alcoholivorax TaxID=265477 RepID=UPI00041FC80E|nr:DUF86 domain-containing protein [Desulfotruncus alcoholivorax]
MLHNQTQNFNINHDLIQEKLSDIEKSVALIKRISSVGIDNFIKDEIISSGAKYQLILAIEAAQSICNHLAARVAKVAPTSYADCFRIMQENKIISGQLTPKLVAMAKFRNLLVHQYGKINDETVYNILTKDVEDLLKYANELKTFLRLRNN